MMKFTGQEKLDLRMCIHFRQQHVIELIMLFNDEVLKVKYENELKRLHELKSLF